MGRGISVTQKGNFKKTDRFLHGLVGRHYESKMRKYGERGVAALKAATPKDSGKTADSWTYEIVHEPGRTAIYWKNTNIVEGDNYSVNVAIILQHGHATRNGGFVEGVDYINPAIKPIFEQMAQEVWKEVVQ